MVPNQTSVLKCLLALLACSTLPAAPERYRVLTFRSSVDATDQPYALYAPSNLRKDGVYPLVISLHGAGQTHRQGLRQVFGVGVTEPLPEVNFLVAAPLGRGSMGYEGIAEIDVYDLLAHLQAEYPVDANRVYLTGVSMGGSGTLTIGLRRPDLWAAIAVVCGGAPSGTTELAGNALNVPIYLFHGDKDTTVPIEIGRRWHELFRAAGVNITYKEFPGEGHNIAPLAYRGGSIFDWFAKHRRAAPREVSFATRRHAHNSAYWLRIDSFEPGELATISVKDASIRTTNVQGFTLNRRVNKIEVDGSVLEPRSPASSLHFAKTANGWTIVKQPVRDGKRPGRDGPLSSVLAAQHAYVYGTMDPDSDLWQRQELAQRAADWSGRRARPSVSFPVISDLDASTVKSNLVVFGTSEINQLLRDWSALLPLALKPAAASEYGLVFVAPVGERLILVSSGLPWWTGASQEQQQSFRWQWLSLPYRLLNDWPDYILFRKSISNIVASGTFDRDWRLREKDAAVLRETVTFRSVSR